MPIHVEGSTAWKEVQAVGDFLMESKTHARLFREKLSAEDGGTTPDPDVSTEINLETGESHSTLTTPHVHEVTLSNDEVSMLKSGGNVTKVTSERNAHQHTITIKWHKRKGTYYIALCASTPELTKTFQKKCKDRHPAILNVVANE
jgi:hypothetical protein